MPGADRPDDAANDPVPAAPSIDRRALERLIQRAAADSYGVAAVGRAGWRPGLLRRLGLDRSGVNVSGGRPLRVEIDLVLMPGVPSAQVAHNVADAVRYLAQRDMGLAIADLVVRVDGVPAGAA